MQVFRHTAELAADPEACHAVTIGNFDGVHLGHQRLVAATMRRAIELDCPGVVITFDPHPLRVLRGLRAPGLLTTLERKLDLLASLGVEKVLVLEFTRELAQLTAEQFVQSILVRALKIKSLVIGYDNALGKDRQGGKEQLTALGKAWDFEVVQVEPLYVNKDIVSSSRIREYLTRGMVREAAALLGRDHSVCGDVIHGAGRGGKTLGFPTINVTLGEVMLPARGVYAVRAEVQTPHGLRVLPAVANVGINPTFDGEELGLEAHVLDFHGDLYSTNARIAFADRIRDERRFASPEALARQIADDIAAARRLLA